MGGTNGGAIGWEVIMAVNGMEDNNGEAGQRGNNNGGGNNGAIIGWGQ